MIGLEKERLWQENGSKRNRVVYTYKINPGESGAYCYSDNTGMQLNDDELGVDECKANLGKGPAYEWVGWAKLNPVILVDLGSEQEVKSVGIHANNRRGSGGFRFPHKIEISMSPDGQNLARSRAIRWKIRAIQRQGGLP